MFEAISPARTGFMDVCDLTPPVLLVEAVRDLLTPEDLLARDLLPSPEVIRPEIIFNVGALFQLRSEVQHLKLLPIKDTISHEYYNSLDREKLLEELLRDVIQDEVLVVADNQYPYLLPAGIKQEIIWVADERIRSLHVAHFVARLLVSRNQSIDDIILFERPAFAKSLMVKGSFKQMRHVHLWTRNVN